MQAVVNPVAFFHSVSCINPGSFIKSYLAATLADLSSADADGKSVVVASSYKVRFET